MIAERTRSTKSRYPWTSTTPVHTIPVPVQRQEEEDLAVGKEEEDHLHAGRMRLDHAVQGVPVPGLELLVVEEFVGRMRLCSSSPAACQQALDW